jgi:hypothetical protein
LKTSRRVQGIAVVTFQRRGRVTYALVAFYNRKVPERFYERKLKRILRSFRAQRPNSR